MVKRESYEKEKKSFYEEKKTVEEKNLIDEKFLQLNLRGKLEGFLVSKSLLCSV